MILQKKICHYCNGGSNVQIYSVLLVADAVAELPRNCRKIMIMEIFISKTLAFRLVIYYLCIIFT